MYQRILLAAVASAALMVGPAMAGPLEITNVVYQDVETKLPDGKTEHRLAPASTVTPGQEVVYVVTVSNSGDRPADQLVITNPVPASIEFVAGDGAVVSVDGGRRFGALSSLTVRDRGAVRAARPNDVTHVRWTVARVAPGSSDKVSFRARLK